MGKKKTKIVTTIGPASSDAVIMSNLIKAGANVFRLNFSHGDYEGFEKIFEEKKKAVEKVGEEVAILQDLCGPKIRIGDFDSEKVTLEDGADFTITVEDIVGDVSRVSINYKTLNEELKKDNRILLDDGKVELLVEEIDGNEIHTKVIRGGTIRGRRGVNLPGAYLKTSSLTEKDRKDVEFGMKLGVDFVGLSFVRTVDDVNMLRDILEKGKSFAKIISKIETEEAVDNFDAILEASDGIMVARGDLAVEIPAERVPMVQKMIIKKCREAGKPVITATQMLESMITTGVPTRAEVSDVANAILDGTDAVMLSAETATGDYPVDAVKVMTKVAHEVEAHFPAETVTNLHKKGKIEIPDSISGSVVNIAHDVGAKLVVALTDTGFTARMISRYRPDTQVIALTPDTHTYYSLMLTFGCVPVLIKEASSLDEAFKTVREFALKNNLAKVGDKVVVSAGAPFSLQNAKTNMLFVEVI